MDDLIKRPETDLRRAKRLLAGAVAAPLLLPVAPAVITLLLTILVASGPPAAVGMLFFGGIAAVLAFLIGIVISIVLLRRRSLLLGELRERIAAHGVRAEYVDLFRNELKPAEKRALKSIGSRDLLLADAYKETLASRITATRIVRTSKKELLLSKRRENSLKQLKSAKNEAFLEQTAKDIERVSEIHDEARAMLVEAEARLRMIEAAAARGGSVADSELALKKLSARASQLPLALEAAKMTDDIRRELEEDLENEKDAR